MIKYTVLLCFSLMLHLEIYGQNTDTIVVRRKEGGFIIGTPATPMPENITIKKVDGSTVTIPWNQINLITTTENSPNQLQPDGKIRLKTLNFSPSYDTAHWSAKVLMGTGFGPVRPVILGLHGSYRLSRPTFLGIQALYAQEPYNAANEAYDLNNFIGLALEGGGVIWDGTFQFTVSFSTGYAYITRTSQAITHKKSTVDEFYTAPGLTVYYKNARGLIGVGIRYIYSPHIDMVGLVFTGGI
ncbi:MAG: hypothetical protein HYV28_15130 [Ignavibacteriales bacterium]|nr:hypothetical protein [Ignavibacteriales bacterium]